MCEKEGGEGFEDGREANEWVGKGGDLGEKI